jgi:DNA-binding NarL/FixJ family response regulator
MSGVTVSSPMSGATFAGEAQKTITVFLLDDREVVRRGVRDLLEAEPDIRVAGEAGTAASALARIEALRPDVAVLDVRLPDGDGVSVCREIRSLMPRVACLMLTSFGDDEAPFDAIMAGAAGYVLKQIPGTDLVGAVRTVAAGQSMLDPRAASQLMARLRDQSARHDPLAGRRPTSMTNRQATALGPHQPRVRIPGRVPARQPPDRASAAGDTLPLARPRCAAFRASSPVATVRLVDAPFWLPADRRAESQWSRHAGAFAPAAAPLRKRR